VAGVEVEEAEEGQGSGEMEQGEQGRSICLLLRRDEVVGVGLLSCHCAVLDL
jgi:hypothetical protein